MSDVEHAAGGSSPSRSGCGCSACFDGFLLWANLSVSLLVIVAGAFLVLPPSVRARALAAGGARRDRRGGDRRQPAARARRPDRRRRARADDGAAARAARPARLVPADRAEHPPVPRLVGLRADRDRDRRERALASRCSASAASRSGRSSSASSRPRSRSSGRSASCARYVRKFAVWVVIASLLYLAGGRSTASTPVGSGTAAARTRSGPASTSCSRSIISWTPLVADYTRFSRTRRAGLLERRARLLRPDDPALRARRGDRAVAPDQRRAGAPDRDRRRRRGERARAARADGRRERRGVRERLLRRGQPAEPRCRGCRSGCSSAAVAAVATVGALLDRPAQLPAVPLSARLVLRAALRGAARRLAARRAALRAATTSSRRPSVRVEMVAAWLAGFCLYQWLYPRGPGVVDAASSRTPIRTRCRGAARRCRASPPPSRSPRWPRLRARGGPYSRARDRAHREPLARPPARRGRRGSAAAPYHGARALQRLRVPARIVARCATRTERELLPPLVRARHAGALRAGRRATASFAFSYDGDRRTMTSRRSATRGCPRTCPTLPTTRAGCTSRRSRAPSSRSRRSPRSRAAAASRSTARASSACRRSAPLRLDDDFDRRSCATSGC